MNELTPIENQGQRVLTTEQLAELYGTTAKRISDNFKSNAEKFIEGTHYFVLEGTVLKEFKSQSGNSGLPFNKFSSRVYLWTKRGAARHSKMLGTDQAWDMFDSLEENYFNPVLRLPQTPEEKLALTMKVANRSAEKVKKLDGRVTDLEKNAPIAPGEYSYISRQVRNVVESYVNVHHLQLTQKQRGLLYKDVSRGMNEYVGIKTRTQLRKRDFDKADEYIGNWHPSTATLMLLREGEQLPSTI